MIDLVRLRVLRELQLRGTVGAVADALGYSPSAVSQQLAQLQKDVGVRLTERVGRRLRLTEAGETLARAADGLLAQARQAEEAARAACGVVAGTVRIVAFQTALLNLVAPALDALSARYPDLVVEVLDDEFERALQALVLQEVDLVISNQYDAVRRPRTAGLTDELLLTEPTRLILPAGHRLAATEAPVRVADLAGEVWASGHPGTAHAELTERLCVEHGGFRPEVRYRSNDLLVILALAAHGQAIVLLPELVRFTDQSGIAIRDLADADVRRRVLVWTRRDGDVRPSVRAVLDALHSAADGLASVRPGVTRGE
ncbi:LysR family transcriptional regulator [Actinoallomurus rhizosphaericola]|uniref:LysR family transcriptional regulator n=1 Tax=Actinoallomurus rhizosphaericola TaxID=2952536 RepID=UPI0020913651|nr:LysR family transcriptional regulator [Actinoallomurus rhizosphaericola]MCO5994218.1 LysR family transcriptional regulator [Actinoallomurus rhizosphaericola]